MIVRFRLEKLTPGAVRYQETDEKGQDLKQNDGAKIGTLYVRKTAFNGGAVPPTIEVEIKAI